MISCITSLSASMRCWSFPRTCLTPSPPSLPSFPTPSAPASSEMFAIRARTGVLVAQQQQQRFFASAAAGQKQTFQLIRPFQGHKLEKLPPNKVQTTKDELLGFYRTMVEYRRLEIIADNLYKERAIRGFCHLYDGQEAIVTGMMAALHPKDSVITAYREHCHQLAKGDTPAGVLGELMGRANGCSRGKGGSMHMYWPENNFYGGNGIVGAQVPLGAGLAFAHKYRGDGGIAVAAYGDGAANQGQLFEAANMAALWKLPMIFVCENNQYGMGTSAARAAANDKFYTRGDYVPGIWVDGMDVLAVKQGFEFAADWARSGKGPIFLEAHTYRYHGHSMSDPGLSYRSREEVQKMRAERDCIELVRQRLLENKWATVDELKTIDREVRKEMEAAAAEAKAVPELEPSEAFTDVWSGEEPKFVRTPQLSQSVIRP